MAMYTWLILLFLIYDKTINYKFFIECTNVASRILCLLTNDQRDNDDLASFNGFYYYVLMYIVCITSTFQMKNNKKSNFIIIHVFHCVIITLFC